MKRRKRTNHPDAIEDGPESQPDREPGPVGGRDLAKTAVSECGRYQVRPEGIFYYKPGESDADPIGLTNFAAVIDEEVELDDGVECRREFVIRTRIGKQEMTIRVSSDKFASMTWPAALLGSRAIVFPGYLFKDHARTAIQSTSKPRKRRVYTHSGWTDHSGAHIFIHAGGAIGPEGSIEDVDVHLRGNLGRSVLPDPPDGKKLRRAVRASLRLLQLGRDEIIVPMLAAIYRALLGGARFSVFLAGGTGRYKTEAAALAQQHFGAELGVENLPANWSSTVNSLEEISFLAKDMLLVIDEFVPRGPRARLEMHAKADRFFRAVGNRSGRGRLGRDCNLLDERPPRGLPLATGEDIPLGHSVMARVLLLNVGQGDIDVNELTPCQKDAAAGLYAQAMAGFLQMVAADYNGIRRQVSETHAQLRAKAAGEGEQHPRTPDAVAGLGCGLHMFLRFALSIGAIDKDEAKRLWRRGWTAIKDAGLAQDTHQGGQDPVEMFANLLRAALDSDRVKLDSTADRGSYDPTHPASGTSIGGGHNPIGWYDESRIYLIPEAAYSVVQRLAGENNDSLPSRVRLWQALAEAGVLEPEDRGDGKTRYAGRVMIRGERKHVLMLDRQALLGERGDENGGDERHR